MVTDEHVDTLRLFLKGDVEGHNARFGRLDRDGLNAGYLPLVTAAFFEAADRRFGKQGTKRDVVAFVGNVRTRSDQLSDIDPDAAERLILAVFTDEDIVNIDDRTRGELYPILLAGLVADEGFSAAELDKFLGEARKLADELSA